MMNFEYTLFHPKGEIKVKVTGATANAAMATVQMGHEIVAMMGGNVAGQAPVEIAPEQMQADPVVVRGHTAEEMSTAFETPVVAPQPEQARGITVDGNPYPATNNGPEEVPQLDSAGTPFDPELHTGTLKKDGTWRLKKGAASKVEGGEEADEGEPEGNASASPVDTASDGPTASAAPETEPAADEELPDITDTELQRYCGRLVQHFGKSDPVFALAAEFVPDGEMPRPTMIKDQAKRREFIAKAQEQTGVIYHG